MIQDLNCHYTQLFEHDHKTLCNNFPSVCWMNHSWHVGWSGKETWESKTELDLENGRTQEGKEQCPGHAGHRKWQEEIHGPMWIWQVQRTKVELVSKQLLCLTMRNDEVFWRINLKGHPDCKDSVLFHYFHYSVP